MSMTISPRVIALLSTLLLAAAPAFADDAGHVRWPVGWKAGEVATYSTESVVREKNKKGTSIRRTTGRPEIRTNEAGDSGYVLTWVTRDSRIEAVEGDRSMVDAIAPILDKLDGMEIVIELDRDGRYRRVRNLQTLIAKVRATMLPVFAANLSNMFEDDPKISKADRNAILKIAQDNLEASIDDIITPGSVETMSSEQAKTMTVFVGKTLEVGKRYRDREPMESPNEGRSLQADREYVLSLVDDDPNLARIRWTHTLDTAGNAQSLWALVDELTSGEDKASVRKARPSDLALREEGVVVFRRDTGAVEMLETTEVSRYGTVHDEQERFRMRRSGTARTWAQEDAAKP